MKFPRSTQSTLGFFLFASSVLFGAATSSAQAPAADTPAIVLRDAMLAACTQNADNFRHALTARNAAAFSRITPTARTTFLKRFVLLENAGPATQ